MSSLHNSAAKSSVSFWQTKLETVKERNKFMFENSLLSDVCFVVNSPSQERHDPLTCTLVAHKYVLATASPVFCVMFYGELAETANTISLPDCDLDGFREFLRYLYCDEVRLTGANVMQVLYLSKKYIVPSLAKKCSQFLRNNLDISNVLQILPDAEKYQEEDLVAKCWSMIDENANELLKLEDFQLIDHALLESILERTTLDAPETQIFKAVNMWASKRFADEQRESGIMKRAVLGDKLIKLIRFPLISQDFFRLFVMPTELLNPDEIEEISQYYKSGTVEKLTFSHKTRRGGNILRCKRFSGYKYCAGWWYAKIKEAIVFSVDKRVQLYGVRLFGDKEGASYAISMKLYEKQNSSTYLFTNQAVYVNDNSQSSSCGFDVNFERPVPLKSNVEYVINTVIDGPPYFYGTGGQSIVISNGVKFTFNHLRPNALTSAEKGQYSEFIFKKDL